MSVPKLLLISNSTLHGQGYLEYAKPAVKQFFSKYGVTKILFIPYALKNHSAYAKNVRVALQTVGIEVESIHEKPDAVSAVKEASGIYIGGGNSFLLLKTLYDNNLINPIRTRVLNDGVPYMGISAGSNVATMSISTTNDMPICYPPSLEALKLVPFNINPHYIETDSNNKHMGETRDERLKEFHEHWDTPILALKEGCMLLVEGNKAVLQGITEAKLFEKGKKPVCYKPEDDVSFLL